MFLKRHLRKKKSHTYRHIEWCSLSHCLPSSVMIWRMYIYYRSMLALMPQAKGKVLFNLLSASIYYIRQPWIPIGQHGHNRSALPVCHMWGYVLIPYNTCFKKRKECFLMVVLYDHVVVIALKYNSCWTKLPWIAKATAHPPYGHSTLVINLLIAFAFPAALQISSAELHAGSLPEGQVSFCEFKNSYIFFGSSASGYIYLYSCSEFDSFPFF